jgi:hypothetical protein
MNVEELTVKVAVLRVRRDQQIAKYEAARKLAEQLYAPLRLKGAKTFTPVLPGGIEAGSLAVKAGRTDVVFYEDELLKLVWANEPASVEKFVPASALADQRVQDFIREKCRDLVQERVNVDRRAELAGECAQSDGVLLNTVTRKGVKVANVFKVDPNGEFAYTPGTAGTAAILAALAAGTVTEDGDIVPQPAGGGS